MPVKRWAESLGDVFYAVIGVIVIACVVITAYTVVNRTVFLTVNVLPPGSSTAVQVSPPRR